MIWIFIITLVFILSIGLSFFYDYKNNKKDFKKSLYGVFSMIIIYILVIFALELLHKIWNIIVNKQ